MKNKVILNQVLTWMQPRNLFYGNIVCHLYLGVKRDTGNSIFILDAVLGTPDSAKISPFIILYSFPKR